MTHERTRRWFIRTAAVAGLVAGGAGVGSASGCKTEPVDCDNKFGGRADQPGNDPRYDETKATGHDKDDPENGGLPHDIYISEESPNDKGQRVGHCKFDDRFVEDE